MVRKILKDFTFSDGTTVPAGVTVALAGSPTHLDAVSIPRSYYLFKSHKLPGTRNIILTLKFSMASDSHKCVKAGERTLNIK